MNIQPHGPNALRSANTLKALPAVSLFTLGCVAIMFSASTMADDNTTDTSPGNESAYAHINKSEESLLNDDVKLSKNSGNVALISQIGDGNRNIINQNRITKGSANFASIDQDGNSNNATINQEGSQNTGLIYQEGNRLEANITQTGDQFESQVYQYGFEAKVNISQSGSGYRSINVEQQSYSGNASPVTIDTN
ncbi:hypothetical protein QC823_07800 [Halomonas vilamensis]|uniref:Curlin associated repeat-containing protein n=1 Tax=Vreelandella vilamensis TaxID=531309 RepID=A0ABU1H3L0_9GAMM|nr:hypothetical protein [Halomonas vilamensis]MDR5898891.1 hypothetical protein [Halomonas vilamensis]